MGIFLHNWSDINRLFFIIRGAMKKIYEVDKNEALTENNFTYPAR